jgi:hypothetical protein
MHFVAAVAGILLRMIPDSITMEPHGAGTALALGLSPVVERHAKMMESMVGRSSVLGQVESILDRQAKLMDPFGQDSALARQAKEAESMLHRHAKMMESFAGSSSVVGPQAKVAGFLGPTSLVDEAKAVERHAKTVESMFGPSSVVGQRSKMMESMVGRSSVLGQVESILDRQAKLMDPFNGLQSGLATAFGQSYATGLQSKFEAALGPSFFGELKATTLMADVQAKAMQMAYGPYLMHEQQAKLMDPLGLASIVARAQAPGSISGAAAATSRTTDYGLVVLDEKESSQFLEWLRSRSPSLAEVKMVCEWLHLVEALVSAIMYYALHEMDSSDPGIALAFALVPVVLSAVAKRRR